MQPLVSVIITSYNNSKDISRAIKSVKAQTYSRVELIIIDDNSSDNSLEIISKYHPDKLIVNPHNIGPYQSRINALKLAKGDFVTFLDADDWLDHHAIEKCVFSANYTLSTLDKNILFAIFNKGFSDGDFIL